eukprot:1191891-Prorocentrum_minimum.AAC.6
MAAAPNKALAASWDGNASHNPPAPHRGGEVSGRQDARGGILCFGRNGALDLRQGGVTVRHSDAEIGQTHAPLLHSIAFCPPPMLSYDPRPRVQQLNSPVIIRS